MSTISRRTFLATLGLTALGALLTACGGSISAAAEARSDKPRQSAPQVAPDDLRAFAAGHNRFGLAMYRLLGGGNLFFSPYSIAQVLTMTSAGARGQTAQQMAQTLHSAFPQERLHPAANALDQALSSRGAGEDGFHLEIANSIWGQQGFAFQPEFLDTLATNYGAGLRLLDFKTAPEPARTTINATIAQQTHDKITDLLPAGSIDANTRLVLANAIYFNAKWLAPFAKEATRDGTFNPDQGGAVTTPMMTNQANYPYMAGQGYQAIALPYRGGVSMLVLLPDAGQLSAFEAGLDDARLQSHPGWAGEPRGAADAAEVRISLEQHQPETAARRARHGRRLRRRRGRFFGHGRPARPLHRRWLPQGHGARRRGRHRGGRSDRREHAGHIGPASIRR